ncbi:MAG: diacylglycerol kinase family lipid kinase [Phycisphaerae bacterium]|nr:diacylglycerol kinase family lipid kinase [Phycisphaerae bacterium]
MNPQDGYIQYIVNPKSGASSANRIAGQFKDYLVEKGYEVRLVLTESLEHACELATQGAVDYRCALVTAAGGDGTLREVLHGLEGSNKLFLPIPCGTENLLANELGFDLHVDTLVKAFEGNCIRPLDLGTVNGRCFTSIAGFGFDGSVIHRISAFRTGHISHLTYFWPIWRTFWEHPFPPIKVIADGKEIFNDRGLVFIGNTSRYAIGLSICKKADFGDGLLDVCIFRCPGQLSLLMHAAKTVFKAHIKSKKTIYTQAASIQVECADGPVFCQIDGDPGPAMPADIKVIPQAIRVLVPPGAKPAGIRTRLRRMIG